MKLNKDSRWYFSTQLIVVFSVTCLIAAIGADAWVRNLETGYLMSAYNKKHEQTATLIARSIIAPVLQNDLAELDALMTAMQQVDETLVYASIVNTDGTVLSHVGTKGRIENLPPENIHSLSRAVSYQADALAKIHMVWDYTSILENINQHINIIRWLVLLTVALLSMVLFSSLKRLVADPVDIINQKLRAISNGESTPKIEQNPFISKEFSYLSYIANRLDKQYQEQLETQKSLAIARDKAETANNTKNEFLGVISHELRTPINGVLGLLEILSKDKTLSKEQADSISVAHASTDSLLAIVSNILDFSNIESGKLQIKALELNLKKLINEAVSSVYATADEKGLELKCELSAEVPDVLMADPVRTRQALNNLLLNAIKFTETGSVTVSTELISQKGDEVQVRFHVKDTGAGISADAQKELFTPFYQGDGSSTRKHGGIGLGLAINQELVNAMGGYITVDSQLGKGSDFSFTLPFKIIKQSATQPKNSAAALEKIEGTVLLAEDNPVNTMVATKMLRSFGLTVVHAANGEKAVDAFKKGSYNAVLMDIQMPEMDGYDATLNIREWESQQPCGRTPVIALTANVLTADRARCFEVGMDDFLPKPIKMTILHKTLKHWLEQTTVTST